MLTILLTIIVLGVLITIHEFGHFIAAKLSGVRVKRFSIGFGPPIIGKKIGETEFVVAAFPFGGYVDMAGSDIRPDQNYGPDEFLGQPAYKRLFIVLAGPLSNLLLGYILFLLSYSIFGVEVPPGKTISVEPEAQQLKLLDGAEILEVNNRPVDNWWDVQRAVKMRSDSHLFVVLKDAETLRVWIPDSLLTYITAKIPPVIARVQPGMPAAKAGIEPGDTIVAINGSPIDEWYQVVDSISAHPGDSVSMTLRRDGHVRTVVVVPMPVEIPGDSGKIDTVGRIGIVAPTQLVRVGFGRAVVMAGERTLNASLIIFRFIKGLFTGQTDYRQVGGLITVGKLIGESRHYGLDSLLLLVAILSINLFVINLLPFPALDGWHILVAIVEGIFKRRMPPKAAEIFQYIGFGLIILLTVAVLWLDIKRWF